MSKPTAHVQQSFTNTAEALIGEFSAEDIREDLRVLGTALGYTETELLEEFPEIFNDETNEIDEDDDTETVEA